MATTTAAGAAPACGATITASATLTADLGPCAHDGLVIGADNVVLDLNGHRIFGTASPGDGAGVRIPGHTGVTVKNGTVSDFDGGVVIQGGSANTVRGVTAHDNIGIQTNGVDTRLGDGIAVLSSTNNVIAGNTTYNNGPYSGIGLYSDTGGDHANTTGASSSGNVVDSNIVDHNVSSRDGFVVNNDNIGIRVESHSNGNTISNNQVSDSGLDGITLFAEANNNRVTRNVVTRNGFYRIASRRGNGIGLQSIGGVGGASGNLIEGNLVAQNADNGIVLRGPRGNTRGASSNTVRNNSAYGNVALPTLPSTFGPAFDLNDTNPNCDSNLWQGNRYGTADPACTRG
jgi:parallel beta-helix repeat protein